MDDQPTEPQTGDSSSGTIFTPHRRTQSLVTLAAIACFLLFWWGGAWVGIPAEPKYQVSLLQQPAWPLGILATYVMLACAVVIGTLIAGRSWFFAGLFTACIGLMALSARGGPMRYVLFQANAAGTGQRVFLQLLVEQCLLFFGIAGLWSFFWKRYELARAVAVPALTADVAKSEAPDSNVSLTLLAQFAITAAIVLLLAATDRKKQVLVGVFIAGFGGTSLAEYFFSDRRAPTWYWLGPFLAGAIGYLLAWFNTPVIPGDPGGTFAALARPLPLDYASAGTAGALLGFWIGAERPEIAISLIGSVMAGGMVRLRQRHAPQPDGSQDGKTG